MLFLYYRCKCVLKISLHQLGYWAIYGSTVPSQYERLLFGTIFLIFYTCVPFLSFSLQHVVFTHLCTFSYGSVSTTSFYTINSVPSVPTRHQREWTYLRWRPFGPESSPRSTQKSSEPTTRLHMNWAEQGLSTSASHVRAS